MDNFFNQLLANPEQMRWVFLIAVFLAVAIFVFVGMQWINHQYTPEQRRVKEIIGQPSADSSEGRYKKMLDGATQYVVPKESKELSNALKQLNYAGYTNPSASTVYYGIKMALGIILGLAILLSISYIGTWGILGKLAGIGVGLFAGMLIPSIILGRQAKKQQQILRNGFPDALDLLVVSVEAGLGFNSALDRVSKELEITHPKLAIQLATVNDEIRAGVERPQALRNLYTRTGLEDIQGLVTLIAQSLRFGTSIADALRVYAEDYRDRRLQNAEEQAALIGTKLIFPLVLCIFPSFFLVMVGPPILGVMTIFGR